MNETRDCSDLYQNGVRKSWTGCVVRFSERFQKERHQRVYRPELKINLRRSSSGFIPSGRTLLY